MFLVKGDIKNKNKTLLSFLYQSHAKPGLVLEKRGQQYQNKTGGKYMIQRKQNLNQSFKYRQLSRTVKQTCHLHCNIIESKKG